MALKTKEVSMIRAAVDKLFDGAEALHDVVVYGIRRAYSNADDKGEFLNALIGQLPLAYVMPVARFARKYGLNVTIADNKKSATVGGPRDAKKQRGHVTACARDVGGMIALVEEHAPKRKTREKKAPTGTYSERADKAIAGWVSRMKKSEDRDTVEVATIINARLQKPKWFDRLASLSLSDDEVDMLVDVVFQVRMEEDDVGRLRLAA